MRHILAFNIGIAIVGIMLGFFKGDFGYAFMSISACLGWTSALLVYKGV